ncbi:hypothetical protein M9458_058143, partial [Cirrhinus mrigala]
MSMTSENQPVPVTAWVADEMKASSPPDSMENNKKDKPTKGKKGKAAHTLFQRVRKAVKRPFFACCDPDRVVRLTPQTDALDDPEVTPVPGPSRITPTADSDPFAPDLVCLPGQVCEYPESPSCVLASCGIKETPDPEPDVTDSSILNLCDRVNLVNVSVPISLQHKVCSTRSGAAQIGGFHTERGRRSGKSSTNLNGSTEQQTVLTRERSESVRSSLLSKALLILRRAAARSSTPASLHWLHSEMWLMKAYVRQRLHWMFLIVCSSLFLILEKAKKGRKRKAVRAFFRRAREAVKQLFPCTVRHPKAEPDHVESQFVPEEESLPEQDQVSADLESVLLEEGPSEIEQEAEDVVLPGSVSSSVSSSEQTMSETASDTEAEPEIELPQGSIVSFYEAGHLIASGKFSKVYEGTHVFSEKLKVAIKCIPKRRVDRYLDIAGHCKPVLSEVALMLRLGEAPSCPNIIQLHQWVEDESSFSLIMEYPEPCRTLEDFILFSGSVSEGQARLFMLQALQAVKHCSERGVYHGDIRSGNILVTLHTLELKFIDFRCARLITSEGFNSSEYQGSDAYTPPEVIRQSVFHAEAANVWAMGILLFEIMHEYLPFESFDQIKQGYIKMDPTLST